MTKMVQQYAEFIFDENTSTDFMDGWPEFIKELVGNILRRKWAKKISKMSDGEVLTEYYRLTHKEVSTLWEE